MKFFSMMSVRLSQAIFFDGTDISKNVI